MEAQLENRSCVRTILLNPVREANRVSRTRFMLEDVRISKTWETLERTHPVEIRTENSRELEQVATSPQLFLDARDRLKTMLASSDTLIFAWGPLRGMAGKCIRNQVSWVISRALHRGRTNSWLMGGYLRRSPRWCQCVGPQRGLFDGTTANDRLMQQLEHCTVETIRPREIEPSENPGNLLGKRGGRAA